VVLPLGAVYLKEAISGAVEAVAVEEVEEEEAVLLT
jgi:hypothetical protein